MKLKNSPKGGNGGMKEKEETLGKEKLRAEFGWAKGAGAVNSGPHFENACRGRKHLLQSQTPPRSSTGTAKPLTSCKAQ
ncbi:unnamed protein product [Sphenostylis stenocarpa]|uniref:Uncharacterized protein n=1 Tax=Sphenostylis stenocarpa TaxID=92480 RepID=A0AA86RWI1_9FABA|nr:unnamed protein product [Sphenostylis stenocarpa]